MAEKRIITGPDRAPTVAIRETVPVDTSSAEQQLAALRAPKIYKPEAVGFETYLISPGSKKMGFPDQIGLDIYFKASEWDKGQVPLDSKSADVTGLQISYGGVINGETGPEHFVTLKGSQTAVEAYGRHYKVPNKEKLLTQETPSNILEFPPLPGNVRRLLIRA